MPSPSFEIDGYEFYLEALKVEDQLRAMTLLAPIIMALKQGGDPKILLPGLDGLQELRRMFANRCKVVIPDQGEGAPKGAQDLPKFANLVFARKAMRLLVWLGNCIELEFGDFLDGAGLKLQIGAAGNSTSPKESIGESGG